MTSSQPIGDGTLRKCPGWLRRKQRRRRLRKLVTRVGWTLGTGVLVALCLLYANSVLSLVLVGTVVALLVGTFGVIAVLGR